MIPAFQLLVQGLFYSCQGFQYLYMKSFSLFKCDHLGGLTVWQLLPDSEPQCLADFTYTSFWFLPLKFWEIVENISKMYSKCSKAKRQTNPFQIKSTYYFEVP